jgi:hypothetical protein
VIRAPGRLGCAIESSQRGEPIFATASRVRRWLLIEQPGAWGEHALRESQLPSGVAAALAERARVAGVRVLLVRDRGHEVSGSRAAMLVRSDRVHRWVERIPFDDAEALLDLDLMTAHGDEPPGIGDPVESTVFLVCTNGKHDPCCADLGRPVLRALRDAGVEVWESSHVGGDRFAANVVCLPTGIYFGRVEPEEAAALLRAHDDGVLDLDRFRGRSCFPPLVQAAEVFARRALEERGLHALHLDHWARSGDQAAVVTFTRGGERLRLTVSRQRGAPELLTCRAATDRPWSYQLDELEVTPGSA